MHDDIRTKLKAERDDLDQRIADHKPLAHSVAVKKVRAYAAEYDMTEDDLFPPPFDLTSDPVPDREPRRNFRRTPYSNFRYEDTLGYAFIGDLKERRYEIDIKLYEVQREAVERPINFIAEYSIAKEEIFHSINKRPK